MNAALATSYRRAEYIARSRSNFYYSFIVLPPEKRIAFCAVYAFMRECDDLSDSDSNVEVKRASLRNWRSKLDAVYTGDVSGNEILPAFRDTVVKFSIPADYFHCVINGAEMDLDTARYETFEDLYKYCFNVASAVGLVCLHIFGFSEEKAKSYAEQCGIAFQLTNIMRDVREDAEQNRIYLPLEDLRKFSYSPEELSKGVCDQRFMDLMAFEAERARAYYVSARKLIPLIEKKSKPALWAMIEIYERILEKIIDQQFNVFKNRIRLPAAKKLSIAFRAIAMRWIG
jgi:phytoene synthase